MNFPNFSVQKLSKATTKVRCFILLYFILIFDALAHQQWVSLNRKGTSAVNNTSRSSSLVATFLTILGVAHQRYVADVLLLQVQLTRKKTELITTCVASPGKQNNLQREHHYDRVVLGVNAYGSLHDSLHENLRSQWKNSCHMQRRLFSFPVHGRQHGFHEKRRTYNTDL